MTQLRAEIVHSKLNLFNHSSLVRYHLSGIVQAKAGRWKPFIEKVHISERYTHDPEGEMKDLGEIMLTPIVGVREDEQYTGNPIEFNIKVEHFIESGGWGKNKYVVQCGDLKETFELFQHK